MTPVIVALVTEGLRKPVQHVSAVAPRVARRSGTGAAVRRFEPTAADTRHHERVGARGEGPERFEPLPEQYRDEAPSTRGGGAYAASTRHGSHLAASRSGTPLGQVDPELMSLIRRLAYAAGHARGDAAGTGTGAFAASGIRIGSSGADAAARR